MPLPGASWTSDVVESGDEYGWSLTAGDFDGDGYDDLAVGSPYEDWGSVLNAGAVEVLYGSSYGPRRRGGDDVWYQSETGLGEGSEAFDVFGIALAAGDFDDDAYVDLAIGVTGEDLDGKEDVGAIHILYGSSSGITASRGQFWHQDSPNIDGQAEELDRFGHALAALPPERHWVDLPLLTHRH